MLISLNTNASPSLVAKLTPHPMSDASKDAVLNAREALLNSKPIAAPTAGSPPVNPRPVVEIGTVIGPDQSPEFLLFAVENNRLRDQMQNSFEDFKSALSELYPDLADKKFSFTVAEDGSLKVLDTSSELDADDMDRLNALLNSSKGLKSIALRYRDSTINLVNADSAWSGRYLGQYNLTKENFADMLDLGAISMPKTSTPSKEQVDGMFFNQMARKAERATPEILTARSEDRRARGFFTTV
ncbi:hypothetical protein V2I80_07335 [Pseudomonas viridiflava]|uniref:hypothetical protein n=1 Tax=Pseudomonas viridiflava TaxID=33069 RepID=UPI002EA913C7|nr:hypothetical protein [Pseudomonas viridiflava]MEE3971778.1 hypothetical protein [Pseudomonas viridiflava]MEE4016628.1 hypothetical protein [Pseudomonas viridiflava]MEE4045252.1 hypothetical protein [Pseudomonas viridiflava]